MKKQIALLATIIAVSGFTAFGQGFMSLTTGTKDIWDEFTTPGSGVIAADMDVAILWAASGTADQLTSVGTAGNMGLRQGPASNQVATNGVTSVGSANPFSTIATMISSGGWAWATNVTTGTTGVGAIAVGATTSAGIAAYTGGVSGTPQFQVGGTTSGQVIEFVAIAWNASASSFSSASDLGWSNASTYTTGAFQSDVNGDTALSASGENQFGVAAVPEPTTLALAGLGGLSMLFLRRRKA